MKFRVVVPPCAVHNKEVYDSCQKLCHVHSLRDWLPSLDSKGLISTLTIILAMHCTPQGVVDGL